MAISFGWPIGVLESATLAGQQVQGGKTVEIRFPVSKYFQDIAAQGGNPRVETGRAVLTFPPGFDPARRWPLLIVTSTTDYHRTSPMDAEWYRPPADAEGWVILASDATIKAKQDSTPWRWVCWVRPLKPCAKIGLNQPGGRLRLPECPGARNGAACWAQCWPRLDRSISAAFISAESTTTG
ncbi:MAG: hypothetical protein WAO00_01990 [Chthoniobacterales bacterium]